MTNSNDALRAALGDNRAWLSDDIWLSIPAYMRKSIQKAHEKALTPSPVAGGDLREAIAEVAADLSADNPAWTAGCLADALIARGIGIIDAAALNQPAAPVDDDPTWPEWASSLLDIIREYTGPCPEDGYEGVDLPEELRTWFEGYRDEMVGASGKTAAPVEGVEPAVLIEWVTELARRDIAREQTDFIGRMHQAMGEFEIICYDHPDGDFDEAVRDDAGEALASLAGLALAQLAMVSNPSDPLSQIAHPPEPAASTVAQGEDDHG